MSRWLRRIRWWWSRKEREAARRAALQGQREKILAAHREGRPVDKDDRFYASLLAGELLAEDER